MWADDVLSQMTLKEKIALCSGKNFWRTKAMPRRGVPGVVLCDGPHGLRRQTAEGGLAMLRVHHSLPATCFPTAVTLAGGWDAALLERVGEAIGREAAARGVGVVLGPGANLKRDPLCGRNFEYFSEDPYLAGRLAAAHITGLQKNGVGASLKHFAANSQEESRLVSDSRIDERTLRELYLSAFETAVRTARPATVMCAYNKLNGIHCSDHKWLLTDVLRGEWGFDGLVVTDWGALNDRAAAFRAGCDLAMPGGSAYGERAAKRAVQSGALDAAAVDASARRVLVLADRARQIRRGGSFDEDAHHALAREAAEQGAVLLQNDGLLPLAASGRVAVIGAMAKTPRYQGAGSSHINPTRLSGALEALPGVIAALGASPDIVYAPGCDDAGDTTDALLAEAARAARGADAAVVFAGLPDRCESEGFDREDLQMPEGHLRMIEAVAAANVNTAVVLLCGGAVECPWADKVRAVLYMGLPGQAGGEAAANLLYGRANPCGRLAESWPLRYADCPTAAHYKNQRDAQYREGLYVGYRYYEKAAVPVRWAFGHGLSYTRFSYSELHVTEERVTAVVTNVGGVPGAEVAQLYLAPPKNGLYRPLRELKGFAKVFLRPGESRTVAFPLCRRDFAVWAGGWRVPSGRYGVEVGGGPRCALRGFLDVAGEEIPAPAWQAGSWYERPHGAPDEAGWRAMRGGIPGADASGDAPLQEPAARDAFPSESSPAPRRGSFTMDSTLLEMRDACPATRLLYRCVRAVLLRGCGGEDTPAARMLLTGALGSPLRCVQISAGLRGGVCAGLLDWANGRFWRGVWRMLSGG